jgi:hypothetical protein
VRLNYFKTSDADTVLFSIAWVRITVPALLLVLYWGETPLLRHRLKACHSFNRPIRTQKTQPCNGCWDAFFRGGLGSANPSEIPSEVAS